MISTSDFDVLFSQFTYNLKSSNCLLSYIWKIKAHQKKVLCIFVSSLTGLESCSQAHTAGGAHRCSTWIICLPPLLFSHRVSPFYRTIYVHHTQKLPFLALGLRAKFTLKSYRVSLINWSQKIIRTYNPVPHCGASVTWSWTEQITLFHQVCFRSQSGFCWFQWRAFFQVAKTLMFQIHESSQDGWWRLGSLWVHFQPWNGDATTAFAVKKLTGTYLESVRLKLTT